MATNEVAQPADVVRDLAGAPVMLPEPERLKRSASVEEDDGVVSAKRPKLDSPDRPDEHPGSPNQPSGGRFDDAPALSEQDTRKLAIQEEKKRGKRLFGGLLSTLSQTTDSPQHKRRQDIERRQQERLAKQQAEQGLQRAKRAARLHDLRMPEQIEFEEEVMRNKHSKTIAKAAFLQTKAQPPIYYRPAKCTTQQKDVISNQVREAKSRAAREVREFQVRKKKHVEQYGPSRAAREIEKPANDIAEVAQPSPDRGVSPASVSATDKDTISHSHDESGDVVEVAEEDTVIY